MSDNIIDVEDIGNNGKDVELVKSENNSLVCTEVQNNFLERFNLSRQDLIVHGCRNCVWKLHSMCAHGLSDDGFLDNGICDEYVSFLNNLAKQGDSANVLWENFNLYMLRLQSLEDYRKFKELQLEVEKASNDGIFGDRLEELEAKRNTYKLWWSKLNDNVLRSLSKIVDREKREQSSEKPRMTVQQLNILMNDSAEKLLEYEKKVGDEK